MVACALNNLLSYYTEDDVSTKVNEDVTKFKLCKS